MTHLLVRHNVADFAKRKPVYDAHLAARQKAGLREKNLLRSVEHPGGCLSEVLLKSFFFHGGSSYRPSCDVSWWAS